MVGIPKQRANFTLTWNYGDWSAVWNMTYISAHDRGLRLDGAHQPGEPLPRPTGPFPFTDDGLGTPSTHAKLNHIGATTYQDIAGTYHADSCNTDFTFGIRNLFDKEPPIAMSSFANSFLPTYYRAPGRFFYGRVGVKF